MSPLVELRHLLLPHHSNNHRAKILHPSTLSLFVAVFLIYQFFINFFLAISPSVLGFASDISPEKVVAITNQKRAERGLTPLKINSLLNEAAQRKAGDMFAFNYWAHSSPSGRSPWSFFKEVGYSYVYAGENLARDFMDSEGVVEAWMNSPTHRDNILNSHYQEIGVAVVNGTLNGVETTLVVQLFGTPPPTVVTKKPSLLQGETGKISTISSSLTTSPAAVSPALSEIIPVTSVIAQARGEKTKDFYISPFAITKTVAIFFLGLVLGALFLDIFLVYRRRLVRLSGKNIAHLIFVGFCLLVVILTTPGAIL